jgi:hypothetical protein
VKKLFKLPDLQANTWMCFGIAVGIMLAMTNFAAPLDAALFNVALGFYYLWLDAKKLVISGGPDDPAPYLTRYHLIRTPFFRVFLHRIHRADKDRCPHNHPWPKAFAFVLRGGYQERVTTLDGDVRVSELHTHLAGSVSWRAFLPGAYHRIIDVLPGTWTLFLAGPRQNTEHGVSKWSFLDDMTDVPARPYLGLPPDHDFGD